MSLNIANVHSKPYFYSINNQHKANTPKVVSFSGQELITPEVTEKLKLINAEIQTANKIAIFTHVKPDGDAIGSAAAMKNLILSKYPDKKVDVFIEGEIPQDLKCLNDTNSFIYIDKNTDIEAIKAKNYDLSIAVDCAETSLITKKCLEIFNSAARKIKIDHHPDKERLSGINQNPNLTDKERVTAVKKINFADINLVCPDASAAGQVALLLAEHMGVELNKDMASDVYLAIVTDTAGFRFMNKPSDVFEDSSKLTKTGIDARGIYSKSMDYMPKEALNFYIDALKSIKFTKDGKIAYIVDDSIREKDPHTGKYVNTSITLNKKGVTSNEVKNIFNKVTVIMQNIEGVKIVAKINEHKHKTEDCISAGASLRGNGVNVAKLAEQYGGGGHKFAAGFIGVNKKAADIVQNISEYLKEKEQQV